MYSFHESLILFSSTITLHDTPFKQFDPVISCLSFIICFAIRKISFWCRGSFRLKKPDNTYRVCVNFKELNKITVFDPQPMMSPDDIFPRLACSKIYSLFDFCKGYYGIPMQEESKDYTLVCSRGLMRFKVMPFGTCGKFRLHIQ